MPPPRFVEGDELSLRHLPDSSDASFSFQISDALSDGDCLLDEDDVNFFRDAFDNGQSATPVLTSRVKPFTLEELTPRPSKLESKPASNAPEQFLTVKTTLAKGKSKDGSRKMTHARVPSESKPSASVRLTTLRSELQELDEGVPGPSKSTPPTDNTETTHVTKSKPLASRRVQPAMNHKRTVASGGVVKSRSKQPASSSTFPRNVVSVPAAQQQALPPPHTRVVSDNADLFHESNSDISICSTAPGGVAERLVMYSQSLLSSFGPSPLAHAEAVIPPIDDPESFQRRESIPSNINLHHDSEQRDHSLTLSQLSPSKTAASRSALAAPVSPGSPMRQSSKRPASAASLSQPTAKKGRGTTATSADASANDAPAPHAKAGSRAPTSSSSSAQGTTHLARNTRGTSKRTRQEPVSIALDKSSQGRAPSTLAKNDASCSSSDSRILDLSRTNNLATSASSSQSHGEGDASNGVSMPRRHERAVLPPVNPTKSVGFNFQVDARIEARKAGFEKETTLASEKPGKQNYHQVPDFKSLHAAQEAKLALRKENIVPVVPLPFEFNTDGRARERERFDNHLREKERELERVLEQKRREKEENEEREIRELRKKAVPRAHEVPEWYKEVPKRKMKDLDSNRD